jgi:hypothetical protein
LFHYDVEPAEARHRVRGDAPRGVCVRHVRPRGQHPDGVLAGQVVQPRGSAGGRHDVTAVREHRPRDRAAEPAGAAVTSQTSASGIIRSLCVSGSDASLRADDDRPPGAVVHATARSVRRWSTF